MRPTLYTLAAPALGLIFVTLALNSPGYQALRGLLAILP